MGFNCGIIGLPNVGKSTLFNALTQSNIAEAANYPFATIEPNIGRVSVPDSRIFKLSKINDSLKTIPTYLDFVDIAGLVKGASKGEGLGNKFLSHIRSVDAIAHVVRCFDDDNITHVSKKIDPLDDIDTINTELLISDLEILTNKKESLQKKSKSGEKETMNQLNIINKIISTFEKENKIILEELNDEEKKFLKELNLISIKPTLYVCNVDEKSAVKGNHFSDQIKRKALLDNKNFILISASIESQIVEFENEKDRISLMKDIGLNEPALNKIINAGYNLLDLITFFTSGPKETRAWTTLKNSSAKNAAGKIHTDFEKGFIRAETISYEDYIKFNGENGCREAGKLRLEGKEYKVKDGDIFNFLFNV
tara:strand:- start:2633 stop:3733 length:1101 start_codon:yes stop_codon:yes gene_type:complete